MSASSHLWYTDTGQRLFLLNLISNSGRIGFATLIPSSFWQLDRVSACSHCSLGMTQLSPWAYTKLQHSRRSIRKKRRSIRKKNLTGGISETCTADRHWNSLKFFTALSAGFIHCWRTITIEFFFSNVLPLFSNPLPPTFLQTPCKFPLNPKPYTQIPRPLSLDPNLQTLNPKPSSGHRFGECKFDMEKSCFLLEKKNLIIIQLHR